MPKNDPDERSTVRARVRAAWRTRACAAGLCVGAQVFLLGAGVAMPLALNAAWLASLAALPMTALIVWACRSALCAQARRRAAAENPRPGLARALHVLLAAVMLLCCAFAVVSLVNLAEQSLLQQARIVFIISMTALFTLLCALSGSTGVSRLCFALRFLLPALMAAFSALSMPWGAPMGLFPLLGAGCVPLGAAAACMLAGACPALMLLLAPPEIDAAGGAAQACPVPGTAFFLLRVLPGAAFGSALLLMLCGCGTYESIAAQSVWGDRLRILCTGQPQEGLPQMMLTICQMLAIALLAAGTLCTAEQALVRAVPRLARARSGLLTLFGLLCALLLALTAFGLRIALFAAPGLILPALALLPLSRRMGDIP